MSEDPSDVPRGERPTSFDWGSPRWQENEAAQGEVEQHRRSRIDAQPRQRGALDQEGSVAGPGASGSTGASPEEPVERLPASVDHSST